MAVSIVTSMTVSSSMVSLAVRENGGRTAGTNYWKQFTAVNFSDMDSLNGLSGGWLVNGSGGTAELVMQEMAWKGKL